MTREFTIDELDLLIAEACKPLHIVDGQPAIVGATSKPFVLYDQNDGDTRIAVAAPALAAFARRLLAERDEARDRLLRAWGEASRWCHGEDCPARLRDDEMDRDSGTCDEDGPVACDCGMDDLWALLDVREALPDTPPTLAEALKRNKALAAERDEARADRDRAAAMLSRDQLTAAQHVALADARTAALADILAALRALPPETVADVRRFATRASVDAWHDRFIDSAAANDAAAARLSALADLLDGLREAPHAS